jgi:hypothetical protein
MKPILSRFCEIYIPEPILNGAIINLYKYNLNETFNLKDVKQQRCEWLKKELNKTSVLRGKLCIKQLMAFSTKLYEKGYSALDILTLLESPQFLEGKISESRRYELLLCFNRVRKEFRNEKLLFLFILNFIFFDDKSSLENISFL